MEYGWRINDKWMDEIFGWLKIIDEKTYMNDAWKMCEWQMIFWWMKIIGWMMDAWLSNEWKLVDD